MTITETLMLKVHTDSDNVSDMNTRTIIKSTDDRYELSEVDDVYHDYDGGVWWHIWDNETKTIIFEDDDYGIVRDHLEELVGDDNTVSVINKK